MKTMKLLLISAFLFCSILACQSILPVKAATNVRVELMLHKAPSVGVVNTMSTAGQVLNTTSDWSGVTQENSSDTTAGAYFKVYFYLYPTLAGTLTLNGIPTIVTFIKANDTAADLTLISTLNKISAAGVRTQISTNSSTEAVNASYVQKTNTHAAVSTTVATDYILELNITMGGSATNMTLYLGYDTATARSRVNLYCDGPVTVTMSKNFESYNGGSGCYLSVLVTDCFGGYDIWDVAPTITWTFPSGKTATSTAYSTGSAQYTNTYVYLMTKPNQNEGGTWSCTATATDESANTWSSSALEYAVTVDAGGNQWYPPPTSWTPVVGDDGTTGLLVVGAVVGVIALVMFSGRKSRKR